MPNTPEDRAREKVDRLLQIAGWRIFDRENADIDTPGAMIRQFPVAGGIADYAIYANGKCARAIEAKALPFCTTAPDNVENYLLKEGDILISRAGSVGENILIKNPDYAAFASYLIRFVPNQEIILPEYMHYFLQSLGYWSKVKNEKSGVTPANLNAKKISAMPIPLPSLKKQKQVVDKADRLSYNLRDTTNRICVTENLIRKCRNSSLAVFMREEKRNGI